MALLISLLFLFSSLALSVPLPATADGLLPPTIDKSGYLDVVEQELARLGLKARCDRFSLTCSYSKPLTSDGKEIREVNLKLSPKTDTIYIFIKEFLSLEDPAGPTEQLGRLLLSYNRELVTAKFEWDKMTDSIRLSTTVNTDSNLDRKSLRSQVAGLWAVAVRLWPELKQYGQSAAPGSEIRN